MIKNFNRFLREHLDNQNYTYTHCEGEIYRHSSKLPFDKAMSENNFTIVGEAFFHLDKDSVDEDDLFFMNTFRFYKHATIERNLVMDYAEHIQTRRLFLAFLDNLLLIEKHSRHKENYTLETPRFYYTNVFYLRDDNPQPIALPHFTMKMPGNKIMTYDIAYPKILKVNDCLETINDLFREIYFKSILDKKIVDMSDDEKKTIVMFYQ